MVTSGPRHFQVLTSGAGTGVVGFAPSVLPFFFPFGPPQLPAALPPVRSEGSAHGRAPPPAAAAEQLRYPRVHPPLPPAPARPSPATAAADAAAAAAPTATAESGQPEESGWGPAQATPPHHLASGSHQKQPRSTMGYRVRAVFRRARRSPTTWEASRRRGRGWLQGVGKERGFAQRPKGAVVWLQSPRAERVFSGGLEGWGQSLEPGNLHRI